MLIALVRADYLIIPTIYHPLKLILSLLLLYAGFLLNALAWPRLLRQSPFRVKDREGMASHGMSIFGKYIPGKFWVVMGRAEYLALRTEHSRKNLASLSLDAQFMAVWTALLLGTIGVFFVGGSKIYGFGVLLLFSLLSLVIFTSVFHKLVQWLFSKLFRRQIEIPHLPLGKALKAMTWYLLSWGAWSIAFWFLAASLVPGQIPLSLSFGFALAGSIGILTVFAPGGLGVREGILSVYLGMAGMTVQDATTIAVASRLWFLSGEIFIFLTALLLNRKSRLAT
jgi:uncharacterized membrane protein YbhN (UPF0104 family)